MKMTTEIKNKNFEEAYRYVERNYAFMFHDSLQEVTLQLGHHHHTGADGLHIRYGGVRGISRITVRNAMHSVPKFVEILVHELTHLAQWTSGRAPMMTTKQKEDEAYAAGYQAFHVYQHHWTHAA